MISPIAKISITIIMSPVACPFFELNDFLFFICSHPLLFLLIITITLTYVNFTIALNGRKKKTLSIEKVS